MPVNPLPPSRFRDEWSNSNWFDDEEPGSQIVDFPLSFSKNSINTIVLKYLCTVWLFFHFFFHLYEYDSPMYSFTFLSSWALSLSVLYCLVSLVNSKFKVARPEAYMGVSWRICVTWVLFEMAASLQLLVTFVFWVFVYERGYSLQYYDVALHGVSLIIVVFHGLVLDRVPVRWKHMVFPMGMLFVFMLWSLVHDLAGLEDHREKSYASLYELVDWRGAPWWTLLTFLIGIFGVIPVSFLCLWLLSLYSIPCSFNGSNRRYEWPEGQDLEDQSQGSGK